MLAVLGQALTAGPLALVVEDLQWADRASLVALTFVLRRLAVDPVLVLVTVRGECAQLGESARRLLDSAERHLELVLAGLAVEEVPVLARALGCGELPADAAVRLHERTGGHVLYLRTLLGEGVTAGGGAGEAVPRSLRAAIAGQLAVLPEPTRALLAMLAVVDAPLPLVRLSRAAGVASAASALEPAVAAGLVDTWPAEPACPVALRHALQRDAIYTALPAKTRRDLHARAVAVVAGPARWAHRVAALDGPDDVLAGQLEAAATVEVSAGRWPLAATHLLWAADVSTAQAEHERRVLTAATHLLLADEARGLTLRSRIEEFTGSPLKDCALGMMALVCGQVAEAEAEARLAAGLTAARASGQLGLAAFIAHRMAGVYALLGRGADVVEVGNWALSTATLDPARQSHTRTLVALGFSQTGGPRAGLRALAHLDPDPAQVEAVDVDGLLYRGMFHLLLGDLRAAIGDISSAVRLARGGANLSLGLRAYAFLALAQYLHGDWDDVTLSAEQGLTAAGIHPRRYELPLLHLAAACVPAGRGDEQEAQWHTQLAEEAGAELDYGQERLFAAMARAMVCQARGDHEGMVRALRPWQDNPALDQRSQMLGVLWRPLAVEGLIGAGELTAAAVAALQELRQAAVGVAFLVPAVAWLTGELAERHGDRAAAEAAYRRGVTEGRPSCPIHEGRLLLAFGRLLRRNGNRRAAVDRLRRARGLFLGLGARPLIRQVDTELEACGIEPENGGSSACLGLTTRQTEVVRLVARGLSNAEVGAELFVTPKTVEYHLGNVYAKRGLRGRRQLRKLLLEDRFVE